MVSAAEDGRSISFSPAATQTAPWHLGPVQARTTRLVNCPLRHGSRGGAPVIGPGRLSAGWLGRHAPGQISSRHALERPTPADTTRARSYRMVVVQLRRRTLITKRRRSASVQNPAHMRQARQNGLDNYGALSAKPIGGQFAAQNHHGRPRRACPECRPEVATIVAIDPCAGKRMPGRQLP
jgi:hypothetical protein